MVVKNRALETLITYLCVLGFNILVAFSCGMAFWAYIFKKDVVLAAVPALVAVFGIVLQPWFGVLLVVPYGVFIAPVIATLITVPVYRYLNRNSYLETQKHLYRRFLKPKFTITIALLIVLGLGIVYCRRIDFPPLHRGLPERQLSRFKLDPSLLQDSRYYCLSSFLDSEWIVRATVKREDVDKLAAQFKMQPVQNKDIPARIKNMPPYWWNAQIHKNTVGFATEKFSAGSRGSDGWHAFMLWNEEDGHLYLWIKDNF